MSSIDFLILSDTALLKQCEFGTFKASGPGGQKKNKTSSAVRLKHRATGITVISSESRSQNENKLKALKKLRFRIAQEIRFKGEINEFKLTDEVKTYIFNKRQLRINIHNYFYVHVFASILDIIYLMNGDCKKAASYLKISTSQLNRFILKDKKLLMAVNLIRTGNSPPELRG
ncbi:MAG: peptide chain release factor-like protein [bacterium]